MTTSLIIRQFYHKFSTSSIEDLENELKRREEELTLMKSRSKDEKPCEHGCRSCLEIYKEEYGAVITAQFDDLCDDCLYLNEEYDNKYNADPILAQYILYQFIEDIEASILAKKKNYEALTDEELEKKIDENYDYSRYLQRSETNFIWSNDEVPIGLIETMEENEQEEKALEFEKQRRALVKVNVEYETT